LSRSLIRQLAVVFGVVLLIAAATFYLGAVRPWQLYVAKNRHIARQLQSLAHDVPEGVSAHQWTELTTLTGIAFGNVFFSPQHASYDEMLRFQADLNTRLNSDLPRSLATLRWVWHRLEQTGPHGKQYCERMIELFDESAGPAT